MHKQQSRLSLLQNSRTYNFRVGAERCSKLHTSTVSKNIFLLSIFKMWMPKISIVSIKVPVPQPCRPFGSNNSFFLLFFSPLGLRPLPLPLPKEEKNDHQWLLAVAKTPPKAGLRAQERTLRLLPVVSGELHVQRNFSSNKL